MLHRKHEHDKVHRFAGARVVVTEALHHPLLQFAQVSNFFVRLIEDLKQAGSMMQKEPGSIFAEYGGGGGEAGFGVNLISIWGFRDRYELRSTLNGFRCNPNVRRWEFVHSSNVL